MKKLFFCLTIILFSVFLSGSSYENIVEENLEAAEKSGIYDGLSDEVKEILENAGLDNISSETILSFSFENLISSISKSIVFGIKEPLRAAAGIVLAIIICSVIQSFCDNFLKSDTAINSVAALSAASVILIPMKNTIGSAAEIITECSDFMLGFIPVYSSASAASGYVSAASGFNTLMLSAATVISRISGKIIVPLIFIYLALCITGAVSEIDISGFSKSVKNFAIWILCSLMAVFSGIMGLGTLITASSDGIFSKTAKFLIGGAVPIVGGTVSDALSAVKGCLILTKNVLGIYAVIIIAIIFIPSAINLFLWKLCLSAAATIGDIFGNKKLSGFISSASSVMGIMLALTVVVAVMFIVSVSIMLMLGGAL